MVRPQARPVPVTAEGQGRRERSKGNCEQKAVGSEGVQAWGEFEGPETVQPGGGGGRRTRRSNQEPAMTTASHPRTFHTQAELGQKNFTISSSWSFHFYSGLGILIGHSSDHKL